MAVFTPQAQNIAPEAPVSVGGGLGGAEVASELFGDAMTANRREAAKGGPSSTLRQSLVNGLTQVRGLLDEGTDESLARASIQSKNIVANYISNGGEWNEETRSIASSITGLPSDQFGRTQAELDRANAIELRGARMQDDVFLGVMSLVARENPELNDEALYAAASERYTKRIADEQLLLEAQTSDRVDFEAVTRSAMEARTDEFIQVSLGGLIDMADQNVPIDVATIDTAFRQWTTLRGTVLRQPRNVTNDQFATMQEKFTQVENMFTNLRTVTSSEYGVERLQSFATQLVGIPDLQGARLEDILTSLLVSSDLTTFAFNSIGSGGAMDLAGFLQMNPTFKDDIVNRAEIRLDEAARTDLQSTLPTRDDGILDPNGTISFDQLPQSIRDQVTGLDTETLLSSIRVDGKTIANVSSTNLTDPAQANMFVNQATRLGTWLMSTDGKALTAREVRELGLGADLGDKINLISNIGTDDNSEQQARIVLRSGLTTQIALQSATQESMVNGPAFGTRGATYDKEGGTFTFTNQGEITRMVALMQGYDSRKLAQIKNTNPEYFDDNGSMIIPATAAAGEPVWLTNVRRQLPKEYADVVAYNDTIGTLTAARDSLNVDVPEDQVTTTTGGYNLPTEVSQDQEFITAANSVATNIGVNVDDLYRIIEFETAGSWSPSVKAPTSSATGLIQFIESTAQGLGTSTADLAQMSRAEQMQYVEKYLEPYKGQINNFGDLYMAVHWPAGIGKDDNYVMYERGSAAYDANKGLDQNGDGTVTRGETLARVVSATGGGRGVMTTPNTAAEEAAINTGNVAEVLPATQDTQATSSAPMSAPAPAARPADLTSPTEVDMNVPFQTKVQGEARTGDRGVIRADNSANYSREIQSLLRNIGVNPSETFVVADETELQDAVDRGLIKTGDKVLVGEGADSFVVEIN
jgi:hypothetical protein